LRAAPRAKLRFRVRVNRARLWTYVAGLNHRLSRPAQNATVVGLTKGNTPIVSEGSPGLQVDRAQMAKRIVHALKTNARKPIPLAVSTVQPTVTKANFGPIIVVKRDSHVLTLFNGESAVRSFGVATGQAIYPTPLGEWSIVDMQVNPWWRPPNSSWAQGLKPIP